MKCGVVVVDFAIRGLELDATNVRLTLIAYVSTCELTIVRNVISAKLEDF